MDQSLVNIISLVAIFVGMIGTFLPVIPGLVISLAGILFYQFVGSEPLSSAWIIIFVVLSLLSVILNYLIPIKTTQKYGGSRSGSIGGLIGSILGLIFFPPFGFLIGLFAGTFLGEIIKDNKNKTKALQATKGAFYGFLFSTGFSFTVGLAMFLVVLINIIN